MLRESELLPIIGAEPAMWNRAGRRHFIGTTAAIIAGSIAAAGAVGGAAIQAHGATSAANTLSNAGQQAAADINAATGKAVDYGKAGMDQANAALNNGLAGSTQAIQSGVDTANGQIDKGLDTARGYLTEGRDFANGEQRQARDAALGNLHPYMDLGAQGVAGMSALMDPTKAKDALTLDPGYQFRMNEAMKALQNTASGRGSTLGGGMAKALTRYGSDYASSEYQKVFDRYGTMAGYGERATNQANGALTHAADMIGTTDFTTGKGLADMTTNAADTKARNDFQGGALASQAYGDWGRLKSATALGGNQWLGNTLLGGAEAAGNNMVGAANGAAAGQAASANAWGNAFSGTANNLSQLYLMTQLGKSPIRDPGMNPSVGG